MDEGSDGDEFDWGEFFGVAVGGVLEGFGVVAEDGIVDLKHAACVRSRGFIKLGFGGKGLEGACRAAVRDVAVGKVHHAEDGEGELEGAAALIIDEVHELDIAPAEFNSKLPPRPCRRTKFFGGRERDAELHAREEVFLLRLVEVGEFGADDFAAFEGAAGGEREDAREPGFVAGRRRRGGGIIPPLSGGVGAGETAGDELADGRKTLFAIDGGAHEALAFGRVDGTAVEDEGWDVEVAWEG